MIKNIRHFIMHRGASEDEHFYESEQFGYHRALNGFGLSDDVLKKLYRENALKLFSK